MSKTQIDKLPGEDSFAESLERVHQAERKRLHRALARELGRPLQEWEIEFLDKYLEKVGEELDRYIVYEYGEKQVAGKLNNPDDSLLTDEESITIQTGQTYGKSANCIDTQVEQIKKEAEKNPNSLWAKGLKSFDGLDQVMENREKHQLSGETPTNTPTNTSTNGTYIRDGRLMHDLVYRGEAEVSDTDLISRQAAIDATWFDPSYTVPLSALIKVRERLNMLPSAQPEKRTDKRTETHGVCSDCISRQAAIGALQKEIDKGIPPYEDTVGAVRSGVRLARDIIEDLPTVEPERPLGEWVLKEHLWECDQCGCRINRAEPLKGNIWNYNYCPNCGTRMFREDGEE